MGRNRMIGPIRFRLTTFVASVIQKKKKKERNNLTTQSSPKATDSQTESTKRASIQNSHRPAVLEPGPRL